MAKNIVICCDGTGNEIERNLTSVLKFYRIMEKSTKQRVYYNTGVGTIGQEDVLRRFSQKTHVVLGLATGYGLDDDILGAYQFVCQQYEPGDRIWLFGFSRGAYTVRALAGLIHVIGLLPVDQLNLAGHALTAYKDSNRDKSNAVQAVSGGGGAVNTAKGVYLKAAWAFARVVGTRRTDIEFLGVWDTVASVIVPRGYGVLPGLQTLRFTRTNPSVKTFRHAMAIDERRRMFRLNRWTPAQSYRPDPFNPATAVPQDIKEVWFAGVHADIGGGYPEPESGLSKFPLGWMVSEAAAKGLIVDQPMVNRLVNGLAPTGSSYRYTPPDATAMLHQSMILPWRPLEYLPKRAKWQEWTKDRSSFAGWYLPLSEPRVIPEEAMVHRSVQERMQKVADYKPVNLPNKINWI